MLRFLRTGTPIVSVVLAGLLVAPSHRAGEDHDPPSITPEMVLEHDRKLESRVVGLLRARLSYPQQLSGAIGAMKVRQPADYECATVCDFKGWLAQLEPGIGGGQLSVGWGLLVGEKKRNEFFLSDVYMGIGVKAALFRTWGNATLTPPGQTFVGFEGAFTVTRVNFSLGLFRCVSDPSDRDWLATAGIGWGF